MACCYSKHNIVGRLFSRYYDIMRNLYARIKCDGESFDIYIDIFCVMFMVALNIHQKTGRERERKEKHCIYHLSELASSTISVHI